MQLNYIIPQIISSQPNHFQPLTNINSFTNSQHFVQVSNFNNTLQVPSPQLIAPSSTKSNTSTLALSSSKSNKNIFKAEFDIQKILTHSRRQSSTTSHQTTNSKVQSMYTSVYQNYGLKKEFLIVKKQNEQLRNQIQILKKLMVKQSKLQQIIRDMRKQKEDLLKDNEKAVKNYMEACKKSEKEYNLYKDITQKLQHRIKILLLENKQLKESLEKNSRKIKQAIYLQSKIDKLKKQSEQFQNAIREDNEEWELFKVIWKNEKGYYQQVIRKLEFQLHLKKQS